MSSNPYTFQRASTMATRSLVSDAQADSNSTETETESKPTLQRRTTNHYEEAAAAAAAAKKEDTTTEDSGNVPAGSDRPGFQRQQSWKMSDFKGQQQGQMLAGSTKEQGYSSTS